MITVIVIQKETFENDYGCSNLNFLVEIMQLKKLRGKFVNTHLKDGLINNSVLQESRECRMKEVLSVNMSKLAVIVQAVQDKISHRCDHHQQKKLPICDKYVTNGLEMLPVG